MAGVNAFFYGAGVAAAAMGARMIIQGSQMVSSGAASKAAADGAKAGASAMGGANGVFSKFKTFIPGMGADTGGFADPMTRREAFHILGLREGSNRNKVREQHKKLMILNHPDAGGSPFIASKVNEAKDYILSGRTDMK
eukprot:TRINITY_DN14155_c0_g1_i5.p1 TRINITY_DN14155_c0_g1~~TRINITY_DN14155_c0_g1_i5.p1  ORF type:complete len:139 (-),score=37.31 TRINITY_DN14155_c0_g1_i5:409-825(-)